MSEQPLSDRPVVVAQGVGKRFKLYANPWHRAAEWATFGTVCKHSDFWAVRDVSFTVARGECFGVLGHNGSGKSTLLKILSGAMHANAGTFTLHGRVLSLLELGTGLNHELTGRQNVLQGAQLLGFPPGYGPEKITEIEAFAELGDFFDRPVRTYSSGMQVRLAFSTFACFEPDVFVVDEALSVGDIFFQQKCIARIERMLSRGTTMLFVTHDMQLVQRLCDRAMLLDHGTVDHIGDPADCVTRYYASLGRRADVPGGATHAITDDADAAVRQPLVHNVPEAMKAELLAHSILPLAKDRHGSRALELVAASFQDEAGNHQLTVESTHLASVTYWIRANSDQQRPSCGLHVYDRLGNLVYAAGTKQLRVSMPPMRAGDERVLTFRVNLNVQPGEYTMTLVCSERSVPDMPDLGDALDSHGGLGPITVFQPPGQLPYFYGIAKLPTEVLVHD